MPDHPLAEVFGFPTNNFSPDAGRYRKNRLCPFNNKVPSCTKDKAENPLGVCSVYEANRTVITCPVRFRQDWLIAEDAAAFFFPPGQSWTSLTEIRINDKYGKSAGNIDIVLVSYDDTGRLLDFGALEVQAVYISGNIRKAFEYYMENPEEHAKMDWLGKRDYPRPDYLSSSRKRLAPQLIYKGGILYAWGKKQAVAVDSKFFNTLPPMDEVDQTEAEMAWLIYDLQLDSSQNRYRLVRSRTVYTGFNAALNKITTAEPGEVQDFMDQLQEKLDEKLENSTPPDAPTLLDVVDIETENM
ncbi:MAG TPA: NotI family restriction endonuclease [Ktedonobacteraceae bacterium]|nr:NotI family restriction endonuclease [Ktedonobacteraceae bacterium]